MLMFQSSKPPAECLCTRCRALCPVPGQGQTWSKSGGREGLDFGSSLQPPVLPWPKPVLRLPVLSSLLALAPVSEFTKDRCKPTT